MSSLDDFATGKLAGLDGRHLRRTLVTTARRDVVVERDGRRLVSFSCNDYLGLSSHPALADAARDAIAQYGVGAGASRLVTGNHPLYDALESRLARLKGTAATCVFGSGYLANTGIIPALVGSGDLVLIDELAHACLWAGARLSGATVLPFRHNDLDDLRALLDERRTGHGKTLILTDGVFSMDGDLAPLPALGRLAREYDAWLMADDAHGIGVLGRRPRLDLRDRHRRRRAAADGNAVEGDRRLWRLSLRLRAGDRADEEPRAHPHLLHRPAPGDRRRRHRRARSHRRRSRARRRAARQGARLHRPCRPAAGDEPDRAADRRLEPDAALAAARLLEAEGFLVVPIRPPTVPAGTARLRFAFTARHDDADIARLADLVRTRVATAA